MKAEEAEELCQKVATQLGEHFDAVQILVSWNEDNSSYCVKRGCGNWYARKGMAHEFIDMDAAQITANEISQVKLDVTPEED